VSTSPADSAPLVACDLGASNGRVFAGWVDDRRVRIEAVHRFPTHSRVVDGRLRWDVRQMWQEVQAGLRAAWRRGGGSLRSLGVDAWGVDFGLLDRDRRLLADPVSYRDPRTSGAISRMIAAVPEAELFDRTGNQTLAINTLIQLRSMVEERDPILDQADLLLTIPDLFQHWLCGSETGERTNATTTQCFDPVGNRWDDQLLDRLGIPASIFPLVVDTGTVVGALSREILGVREEIPVIAPASHDTASAVAGIPVEVGTAFVSAGSWLLVGVERDAPVRTAAALAAGLTNEGGVDQTTLLLSVVSGLWLLEMSREAWRVNGLSKAPLDDLLRAAEASAPLQSVFDPNAPALLTALEPTAVIQDLCRSSGQTIPDSVGALTRAILESLALRVAQALDDLERVTEEPLTTVRVIGGGSRNRLLCQWIADASARPVVAGPGEATVLGNIAAQAYALGLFSTVRDARASVSMGTPTTRFEPTGNARWLEAGARLALTTRAGATRPT
jgi:rhamnulokinase